jgi:hypothetical protein
MGELSERREQLRGELANIDQLLHQARIQKHGLIQRVQELGGRLPTWELSELNLTREAERV